MLGLAKTDLCTKFEISTLTHYKDMKGDEKCKNVGGLGHPRSSATQPFDSDFLFNYNRSYASTLNSFRVVARFSSKLADFNPPYLHLSPPYGVIQFEFRRDLWRKKTRVSGAIVRHCLHDPTFRCESYHRGKSPKQTNLHATHSGYP